MPACPICARPLETARQREGLYYPCLTCGGRAVTIPQIRHVLGDQIATKLLRLIKMTRRLGERQCPFCEKPMLALRTQEPPLELDACRPCSIVWFDGPTYDSLPQLATENMNSRTMEATEIIALTRLRELKEREQREEEERRQQRKKQPLHRIVKTGKDDEGSR